MIEEQGTVIALKGKHVASVLCEKSNFCRNCASMEACQVGTDNKSKIVEAHNTMGAGVGDRVRLVTSTRNFLKSSFLLYVVPLISLVVGAVIGNVLGERMEGIDPNLLSAILGSAFLAGSYLIIRVGSRAIPKENYMPRIVEIIPLDDHLPDDLKNGD
jgi:sigma-E factor negative regulatory protein RseC